MNVVSSCGEWGAYLEGSSVELALITGLLQVLVINVVLSGDNAVVIGLAARTLPQPQKRRAIVLGAIAAVGLRLALTAPAALLLRVPLIRAGGGGLLAWIAYRLLATENETTHTRTAASVTTAVGLILMADVSMSLDNVLAVAAVAERSTHSGPILVIGLGLSIPLVLLGGGIVAAVMNRLPILSWLGGAVLSFTAADLIVDDTKIQQMAVLPESAKLLIGLLLSCLILGIAARTIQRRRRALTAGERADETLAEGDQPRSMIARATQEGSQ